MAGLVNEIKCGDCIEVLNGIGEPFADLVFADPPFNIGYQYDKYHDKVKKDRYLAWTRDWMAACIGVLKPHGSFYIAIGDEYAAHVRLIGEKLGLTLRNWIIWHYTFGQQTRTMFARSHAHIFYFVRHPKYFTFNDEAVRVLSDRQKVYRDKRANPFGKIPDDVWNEFPRVCGTFAEREDWHPCQMPEGLLARIIRASSHEGDWVLDPFSGSGTTCAVAAKLRRRYTGVDISAQYVREARRRIAQAPAHPIEGESPHEWNGHLDSELKWLYHENRIPTDELASNEVLLGLFVDKFNRRVGANDSPYPAQQVLARLINLRKAGKLGPLQRSVKEMTAVGGKKNGQLGLWDDGKTGAPVRRKRRF